MSTEFVIDTKLSAIGNKAASPQETISPKSSVDESLHGFSSEFVKQLDQQNQISKTQTTAENIKDETSTHLTEAEKIVEVDGKIVPHEEEEGDLESIDKLVSSIIDSNPELNTAELETKLRPILEKLITHLQASEIDEADIEDALTQLADQIAYALSVVPSEKVVLTKLERVNAESTKPLQNFIEQITHRNEGKSNSLTKEQLLKLGLSSDTTESVDGKTNAQSLIKGSLSQVDSNSDEQSTKLNQGAPKISTQLSSASDATRVSELILEKIETVVKKISHILTKESGESADTKKELSKTIQQLVKEWSLNERSVVASKAVKDAVPSVEVIVSSEQNKELTKIRSDILQALTQRQDETGTTSSQLKESGQRIVKNEFINLDGELQDKQNKLIELIKAGSQSEPEEKPKSAPRAVTVASSLINTQNGQTAPNNGVVRAERIALDIQPALHTQAWNKVLGSRVVWMAREGLQQASIQLNPANLGPVEVRLSMQNEQANVMFIAQHATTRDALEQALPKLRESFAESGLQLANADVSEQSSGQMSEKEENIEKQHLSSNSTRVNEDRDGDVEQLEVQQDIELGLSIYA